MYDKADILARLAKGEEAQAIADEIAYTLNSAIAEFEKQKEAEKAQAASQKRKEDLAKQILDAILDYAKEFYPDFYDAELAEVTGAEIVESLDNCVTEYYKFKKHLENFDQMFKDMEEVKKKKSKVIDNDPIADFLAEFVDC